MLILGSCWQVNLEAEVKQIDRQQKRVLARDKTGTETWHAYDKLILAQVSRLRVVR